MTGRTRAIGALLVLAGLVVASTRTPAHGSDVDAPGGVAAPVYRTNRFGILASEVWRYRQPFVRRDLEPVANNNPYPEPQPHRDRPARLALVEGGARLYITLPGTEAAPGDEISVVDIKTATVRKRIRVGRRPYLPVVHPSGRFVVVTNELSNYLSVIDTRRELVCGEIPLDYYAQGLVFSKDGRRAWVAIRYLDQVLAVDIDVGTDCLNGRVRVLGGFDEETFFGHASLSGDSARELELRELRSEEIDRAGDRGHGGLHAVLRTRCGSSGCHSQSAGGFLAGDDPVRNYLSAVESSIRGRPFESPLVRAVTPATMGGFGDVRRTHEHHPGGALFHEGDPELTRIVGWIRSAAIGPGIPVGNDHSHPKDLALSRDGRYLFVGNTGTMDVSIIDTRAEREVTGIFLQNVASHLTLVPDGTGERDQLLVFTMGVGFGAPPARDPHGAETWDRSHPAAQFTVLRDPETTDAYPIEDQAVMGPFDAVDGTWAFKMRDIQSDIVSVDLSRMHVPAWREGMRLDYAILTNAYESHPGWVRYTSDTAEATSGDVRGDIPPELMRVVGSFPEWATVVGDRVFVTMANSFEVVEWRVRPGAADPAERLEPVRTYETGLRPIGVVADATHLYVANELSETVSFIERSTGSRRDVVVGDLTRPPLDTDAERGELVVHSSVFSSDGDTSCLHCHYRDTGDGRGWGAAETVGQDRRGDLTPGGTLGIPQMRNIFAIQPYYFEGTHRLSEGQGADVAEPASSIDFDRPVWAGDFTDLYSPVPAKERRRMHEELKERVSIHSLGNAHYDLEERRNAFLQRQTMRWMGSAHGLTDLYRYVAAWLGNTTHLLPNPFDAEHPSVVRGEQLFNDPAVMCGTCHVPTREFTNKDPILTHNARRALPPLTTITRRDASYTLVSVRAMDRANGLHVDLDPDDAGRVEDVEGSFTTMQLRGIFDRPPTFLHHGRARSLREVLCTPGHPALRQFRFPVLQGPEEVRPDRMEQGLNETTMRRPDGPLAPSTQIADTHGGTSHLTVRQIEDLLSFMRSIP